MVKLDSNFIMKTVLPRVMKAALIGILTILVVYYLPLLLLPNNLPQNMILFDYRTRLFQFAMISVFFAVAGQLFAKTIIGHGFGIAKALVIITYFLVVSNGGILSLGLPVEDLTLNLTVDITIILLMVIAVNLLSIAKNLFGAINLLTDKSTDIDLK